MASIRTHQTTWTTASGSKSSPSITTVDGDLFIVIVGNTGQTATPTMSDDQGGTYSQIGTGALKNASADKMFMFVRDSRFSSAVACIVTQAPGTTTGGGLWVAAVAGMQRAGLDAVRQSGKQENGAAAGTPTVPLSFAALAGNLVFGGVMNGSNTATVTPPSGWSERQDTGYNTPPTGLETATDDNGETLATITWGSTSASAFAAMVAELDATGIPFPRIFAPGARWTGPNVWRTGPARHYRAQPYYLGGVTSTLYQIQLDGGITPVGDLTDQANKALSAGMTPTGALIKQVNQRLSGGITPAGSLAKQAQLRLAGGLTPAGLAKEQANLRLSASLVPSGNVIRQANIRLGGSVGSSGALKWLVSRFLAGSLTPAGLAKEQANKRLSGGLTPSSTLANSKLAFTFPTGSIASSGALVNRANKALGGGLTPSSTLTKSVSRFMTGSLATSGALRRQDNLRLGASVSPTGFLGKTTAQRLSGSISGSGSLVNAPLTTSYFVGGVGPTFSAVRSSASGSAGGQGSIGSANAGRSTARVDRGSPTGSASPGAPEE